MKFGTGTVLSCVTDIMLCDDFVFILEFLTYMTEDDIYTHQATRASDVCKPYLIQQHPWLAECRAEDITKENCKEYLAEKIKEHGASLEIQPLPKGVWTHRNPVAELVDMMNNKE